MRSSKFRPEMIDLALQAAEAMRDSPLASKLEAIGLHPAVMRREAEALTALHVETIVTRNAAMQATSDLSARAEQFAAKYASYCNFVRGMTNDPGLRRVHGVKSPGVRKGPMFRRGPRATSEPAPSSADAPAASTNEATDRGRPS